VCVCVRARARERERETKRQGDGVIEGGREEYNSDSFERRSVSGSEHYVRFYPQCREHDALKPRRPSDRLLSVK
jgi:hypothetical protein